ncbi:hypothetical protein [Variovorax sp. GT1P44]|uniref:hypothetical protein n=1 Tax=Variovorax sp. GT1P44 TaxID=3443742 RepID=UPI003F4763FC
MSTITVLTFSAYLTVKADIAKFRSKTEYHLNLENCPISFESRSGGYATTQTLNKSSGYYSHETFEKKFDLGISFQCKLTSAKKHCAKDTFAFPLGLTSNDAENQKELQVVFYNSIQKNLWPSHSEHIDRNEISS